MLFDIRKKVFLNCAFSTSEHSTQVSVLCLVEYHVQLCPSLWLNHKGSGLVSTWGCWSYRHASCSKAVWESSDSGKQLFQNWKWNWLPNICMSWDWVERVRSSRVPWPLLQPWLLMFLPRFSVVQTSVPPRLVNTSSGCIDVCSMLVNYKSKSHALPVTSGTSSDFEELCQPLHPPPRSTGTLDP